MKIIIYKSRIIILLVVLLLLDPYFISNTLENYIKAAFSLIILLLSVNHTRAKSFLSDNCFIIIYGIIILISGYLNGKIETGIFTAVVTIAVYIGTVTLFYRNNIQISISIILKCIGAVLLVMNGFALLTKGKGLDIRADVSSYIFGNKFRLSYLNMLFLCLIFLYKNVKLKLKIAIYIAVMFISAFIDCGTGIVGTFFLGCFAVFHKRFKEILKNRLTLAIMFLICGTIVFALNALLQTNTAQFLIVNVLHRNLTLTGRLRIYQLIGGIIKRQPFWGYGAGADIVRSTIYGNAQNGILNITVKYGFIGLTSFLANAFHSFRFAVSSKVGDRAYFLLAFIYSMIICSIVEVSLANIFIMGLAIVYGYTKSLAEKESINGNDLANSIHPI